MDKEEKKSKKVKISIIASLILSIAFIIIILKFTIDPSELENIFLERIRYEFIIVAALLNICTWFLWGARLRILSNAIDKNVKIGWRESTKIVIVNLFLAGITPSMAGGEPVRIHLLNKDGMSLGGATASVLGERLIDAVFILLAVPFAFFVFKDRIDNEWLNIGLTIGIFVFIFSIILFLWIIKNPGKIKSFLIWLDKKLSRFYKKRKKDEGTKIVNRINREVDNFHNSMVFFAKEEKKAFLFGGAITVLMWSTGFMIPSMILLGLGLPPFFIESYAAQVLLLVIIMMPTTPGSTGVTELGAGGLYSVLIDSSFIGVFVLLFRFITYHMNLIAGAIFQYRIFKSVASFSVDMIKKHEDKRECK